MAIALLCLGVLGTAAAWWLVRARGLSIWRVMPVSFGALGIVAVALAGRGSTEPRARTWVGWADVPAVTPALWGLASGLAFFAATRLALLVLRRWEPFARQTGMAYEPRDDLARPAAIAASLVVLAGEELLWRLGVQQHLGVDAALAAGLTWGAYAAANLASLSLPIIAGATVGGAVWGLAGWLTGGVLAPLLSHAVWTTLMLLVPPRPQEGKMQA